METVPVQKKKSKGVESRSPAPDVGRARARSARIRKGGGVYHPAYPFAVRLRAVKLYLEEEYPASLIASEVGCSVYSLRDWIKKYERLGEQGLKAKPRWSPKTGVSPAVKETIVRVKKENPWFGCKRISQFLRRILHLPACAETVRKTLHEHDLVEKPKRKPVRNPPKPRRFERATPNQMWQTDICTFRLAGKNAYLIGFMDDYSRYITGMEVFRSQTAENVLEVFRRAAGEYNVPREMLTDNGRQYTNWRGTTRFEKELKKDNIKHIRSRPHHPMTLGKIERFWKSIWAEFLSRAQFDSFEQARERLALWIRYYNHRRPHQGIGGLCPADRYFEVQHELRQVIERGIKENVLELALRGEPRQPFYMVGRIDDQSVVMHARKGKLHMTVNDRNNLKSKELVYDVNENEVNCEEVGRGAHAFPAGIHRCTEMPGGPDNLDRAPEHEHAGQPDEHHVDIAEHVDGPGTGRHAHGAGTQTARGAADRAAEQQAAEDAREQRSGPGDIRTARAFSAETPGPGSGEPAVVVAASCADDELLAAAAGSWYGYRPEVETAPVPAPPGPLPAPPVRIPAPREYEYAETTQCASEAQRRSPGPVPVPGRGYSESPFGSDDRDAGSPGTGREPQDVLRVGEPCARSHDGRAGEPSHGQTAETSRPRDRSSETESWPARAGTGCHPEDYGDPRCPAPDQTRWCR